MAPKVNQQLVVDLYYETYAQCVRTYGKVCLLMEVGTFYELYSRPDHTGSNAREVARDLNMKLTFKKPCNESPPNMTGFPVNTLETRVPVLLEKGYTIVIMVQSAANKVRPLTLRQRQMTRVISKATDLDSLRPRNNVVALFIEQYAKRLLSIGMCSIDTTASREVIEHVVHSAADDKGLALDATIEFISQMDPVECIIVTRNGEKNQQVVKQLSLDPNCVIHYMDVQACEKTPPVNVTMGVSEEEEGCGETEGTAASHDWDNSYHLCCARDALFTFLRERFYRTTDLVSVPYRLDQHLDLSSNTISQLDISLLYTSLDKTLTAMGSRLLRERLVRPMLSPDEICSSYDSIEELTQDAQKIIEKGLHGLPDLDRLHRRVSLGRITGPLMRTLHAAYIQALPLLSADPRLQYLTSRVEQMIEHYTKKLDLDDEHEWNGVPRASMGNMSGIVLFFPGHHTDLDVWVHTKSRADKIASTFLDIANNAQPDESYQMNQYGLQTSPKKADTLKKKVRRSSWKVRTRGKYAYVYTDELETALVESKDAEDELVRLHKVYFDEFIVEFYGQFQTTMEDLSYALANLDFIRSGSIVAWSRRLNRPKLVANRCLLVRGLRHLVIEDLNPETKYIPNDCLLDCGSGDCDGATGRIGMTLYGVNACGKSSYLKAVGLSVIMAQAGLFVPAESMVYKPFTRIMTRIAGSDSIVKGQSSFIVELDDLRSVLCRANQDTLILGDEMCRGTEVGSAEALVCTTLQHLATVGAPFVTATHLHDIAEVVAAIPGVGVFHMEVGFDNEGDPIYHRKIIDGPGAKFYGLEIARAHGFDDKFMRKAMLFRNSKLGTSVTPGRVSRYNRKKILIECEVCKYRCVGVNALPLDSHHLNMQCNADEDGFHGSQQKDALHNLVTLCKRCHVKVHSNELSLSVVQSLKRRKIIATHVNEQHDMDGKKDHARVNIKDIRHT